MANQYHIVTLLYNSSFLSWISLYLMQKHSLLFFRNQTVVFPVQNFNTATDFYHLARQICFLPLLDSHIVPGVSDLWLLFCWCGNVRGLVIQSSSKLKEPSLESF